MGRWGPLCWGPPALQGLRSLRYASETSVLCSARSHQSYLHPGQTFDCPLLDFAFACVTTQHTDKSHWVQYYVFLLLSRPLTSLICLSNQWHYCQPKTRRTSYVNKNHYNWIFFLSFFFKLSIGNTLHHVFPLLVILCWNRAGVFPQFTWVNGTAQCILHRLQMLYCANILLNVALPRQNMSYSCQTQQFC